MSKEFMDALEYAMDRARVPEEERRKMRDCAVCGDYHSALRMLVDEAMAEGVATGGDGVLVKKKRPIRRMGVRVKS